MPRLRQAGAHDLAACPEPGRGGVALRVVSICVGVFFLGMGTNKLGWIAQPELLTDRFVRWMPDAAPYARWYLDAIAIPGGDAFARIIPLAELATAACLIAGVRIRVVAAVALFMVMNFHFATSAFSTWAFLRDGTGLPVMGALFALALAGDALPWCVRLPQRATTRTVSVSEEPYSPAP